ncbi:MAG: M24 family metallopeptidase [Candidatus Micrarchaeota archaeon]
MDFPLLLYRGEHFNANFTHFSGMDTDHSFLIVWNGRKTLLVPPLNGLLAKRKFRGEVIIYSDPFKSLKKLLKGKKVHADLSSLPARAYTRLTRFCKVADCTEELFEARRKKSKPELSKLRKAAKLTKEAIHSLLIEDGMTERQLRDQLVSSMTGMGVSTSFEPIVSSGGNTAFPHSSSTSSKVRGFVLVDCGVRYQDYCGDLTRVIFLKENPKVESMYETLQEVTNDIIDALPGMKTGKDVALFSENEMKKRKLPKLIHSIGHGIGMNVHEFPRLSKKYEDKIAGSVFTIEPGVYLKSFGLRFEQMVHFDGKKARIL